MGLVAQGWHAAMGPLASDLWHVRRRRCIGVGMDLDYPDRARSLAKAAGVGARASVSPPGDGCGHPDERFRQSAERGNNSSLHSRCWGFILCNFAHSLPHDIQLNRSIYRNQNEFGPLSLGY